MKAKLKKTGKTIELNTPTLLEAINDRYTEKDTGKVYKASEIDFIEENEETIDWEQVRINAAISILQGIVAHPGPYSTKDAKYAVELADVLIEELKKRM